MFDFCLPVDISVSGGVQVSLAAGMNAALIMYYRSQRGKDVAIKSAQYLMTSLSRNCQKLDKISIHVVKGNVVKSIFIDCM